MSILSANFMRSKAYWASNVTHFSADMMTTGRTVLMVLLASQLDLTNSQVGLLVILYNVGNALTQPLFGFLTDKVGPRSLLVWGIGWMCLMFGLSAVSSPLISVITLTLAGIGSGAIHPSGVLVASQSSLNNRSQSTAIFFMLGQLGLSFGPLFAGWMIDSFGKIGFLILPLVSLVAFVSNIRHVRNAPFIAREKQTNAAIEIAPHFSWSLGILLVFLLVSINIVREFIVNFNPIYFQDQLGTSASFAGLTSGVLMFGYAFGNIFGGYLADRFNNRLPIWIGILGMLLPTYAYLNFSGAASIILLFIGGFFSGMPHSVLVIIAQSLMPNRRALASGLTLMTMFMGGALGANFFGWLADQIGLQLVLQNVVLIMIAPIMLMLVVRVQD